MSLKVVYLASNIESTDDFHLARLLILLKALSGRNNSAVDGIMKLAKLDFLLRYPSCLVRALRSLGKELQANEIDEIEQNTIEAKMIRFRFGPWDKRYRKWIALLVSKGLADTYLSGNTVKLKLTEKGLEVADSLCELEEFQDISKRSKLIKSAVGSYTGTKLKKFVYEVFPEIVQMKWGRSIDI